MIVWNELAEKELKEAYLWYELKRIGFTTHPLPQFGWFLTAVLSECSGEVRG